MKGWHCVSSLIFLCIKPCHTRILTWESKSTGKRQGGWLLRCEFAFTIASKEKSTTTFCSNLIAKIERLEAQNFPDSIALYELNSYDIEQIWLIGLTLRNGWTVPFWLIQQLDGNLTWKLAYTGWWSKASISSLLIYVIRSTNFPFLNNMRSVQDGILFFLDML